MEVMNVTKQATDTLFETLLFFETGICSNPPNKQKGCSRREQPFCHIIIYAELFLKRWFHHFGTNANLKPTPCWFTISTYGSLLRYFLNLVI